MERQITFEGHTYTPSFTRRRYGNKTFTWVNCFKREDGIYVGEACTDPFPCIQPKKSELAELLEHMIKYGRSWIYERGMRKFID